MKILKAIVAAILLATPAAAATTFVQDRPLAANEVVTLTQTLNSGDQAEFFYTTTKALKISDITLFGTGETANLKRIRFGFSKPVDYPFSVYGPDEASRIFPGFKLSAGDSFSIFWRSNPRAKGPADVGATFSTAAVPLPAAAPLLVGALAVVGGFGLRRKK